MQDKIKRVITVLLILGIIVLGVFIYSQISKTGIETVITSVEEMKEKATPKQENINKENTQEVKDSLVIDDSKPEVTDSEDVIEKEKEIENKKPSIIVDKPLKNEGSMSNNTYSDEDLQHSVMREPGSIIEELEVQYLTSANVENEIILQEKIKEQQEKILRNQGRLLAGLEVVVFLDSEGNFLDTSNILSKGTVVIPWFIDKKESLEYISVLNKLYEEYKNKLNIIFLISGFDNVPNVENFIIERGYSFKCYYDPSVTFLAITDVKTNTEVLFINEDDYIVHRFTSITSEEILRNQFDKLVNNEY